MSTMPALQLWDLPDAILCSIVSYVSAPTHRATVLCHQIAPLCKQAHQTLMDERCTCWDTILKEDYGVVSEDSNNTRNRGQQRRACKRLRRSPIHRVREAHKLIQDNTEIAYFYLSELTCHNTAITSASEDKLTKSKLVRLLNEYGPHLRINNTVSSGGLYLVEVCRARHVKESVILKCVQEMVEARGAMVNLSTHESEQSSQTALCVAAVRAMPTVVSYLLQKGASKTICSSGRFRLFSNPRKTVWCKGTPLEFAQTMLRAEQEAGVTERDVAALKKCIRLLQQGDNDDDES